MKELSLHNCRLDGRYDVQALLGRGSYAEIYTARDILASPDAPHNQVVIKALNVFLQDDLDSDLERTLVENFQNEAIALDRVRHPNIISRLGHGTAKDLHGVVFHYLVLEYLSGGDLAKACPKQGLPLEQALDYLEQVCAGLAHAHKSGVIHRDIKPQNLLLTRDRRTVKIADFGVARLTQSDSPITRVGTNMYAPPEHSPVFSDGEGIATTVRLTPAADIYSLAKSAYVLVTGESPRRFSSAPISDLPESVRYKSWANDFLKVLRKATDSHSSERHQNVIDFWKDLAQVKIIADAEAAGETETQVSARPHVLPQPSITDDFSPKAPVLPKFNTSRDLKFKNNTLEENNPRLVVKLNSEKPLEPSPQPRLPEKPKSEAEAFQKPDTPRRKFLRSLALAMVFLAMVGAGLFATQSYLRTGSIFPQLSNLFKKAPQGIALQDINLRPTPGIENPPVGKVPKGSRVRIIEIKDNWIKIDIIEFTRPKENANDLNTGWVNRRFIDVKE